MGVVRREGDWRLEKRRDGVYEITFRREPQLKVYTSSDSVDRGMGMIESSPIREVASYSEAERLFEEKAKGGAPMGMTPSSSSGGSGASGSRESVDLNEFPPYGVGLVFLAAGGFMVYLFWNAENALGVPIGALFIVVGLTPFVYAGYLYRTEDWRAAFNYLIEADSDSSSERSTDGDTGKTPPLTQKSKQKLKFDRADHECEWCDEHHDHLEVHHIKPRSEGGPNEASNLIVLCPNCHRKADRESITRTNLKAKVERQSDISID
jgi:hypothetical protein